MTGPTPPKPQPELGLEELAQMLGGIETLREVAAAVAQTYEEELAKDPDPKELAQAEELVAQNDRVTASLLAEFATSFDSIISVRTNVEEIEGIGPTYAAKLAQAGVDSVETLLLIGSTPSGRHHVHETTGIAADRILTWVNHADLFRIPGVGGEYAELLEAAGVDSVPELAQRNADNFTTVLSKVNAERKLVRSLPTTAQVERWIEVAKTLPGVVKH